MGKALVNIVRGGLELERRVKARVFTCTPTARRYIARAERIIGRESVVYVSKARARTIEWAKRLLILARAI